MVPSGSETRTVRLSTGAPPTSRCLKLWNIACTIIGTPANTKTLPIWKPGAIETGLSISVAVSGMRAMRWRAGVKIAGSP